MAVSVIGPFIKTDAGLVVPVNDPGPLPLQLLKWKLGDACALITTLLPPFCHPLTGSTAPPAPAFIVRKYCLLEPRGIVLVGRRSDDVRDSTVVTPPCPHVLNACATALWRSGGQRMARTGYPGELLLRMQGIRNRRIPPVLRARWTLHARAAASFRT